MIMGLFALLLQSSCQSEKAHGEESIPRLEVTSPLKMDTLTTRQYVAQIRAINHIELRALERGYLQKIYVDEGQLVKKGQLMFQIMPLVYRAELQKAEAEASYAEIEYLNTKVLTDSNVVSPNQLALVRAKFEKAKAELALANVQLGFTEIRAPFDGIMDRFQVREGSLLEDGDLLTTLSDVSKLWVYFNVTEAEYLDYRSNARADSVMNVSLLMANNKMFKHKGVVEAIEADFNNETGNIAFRATFPNPDALLRHGETGNIMVKLPLNNALIIPQKATFEVLDKKYVFVVDDQNVVHSRVITTGIELPDLYEITSGLTQNDKILLEGLRKVRENDQIKYDFLDPKEVIEHLALHAE